MLVQFHPVAGLDAVIDTYREKFMWIRHIVVTNNGSRSTSWWAGLNAVSAEFFGMLDDDDTLFPNHVASIMDRFDRDSSYGFVYSGLIKVEDESGHYVSAPQFDGPAGKIIEERRQISRLEEEFGKLYAGAQCHWQTTRGFVVASVLTKEMLDRLCKLNGQRMSTSRLWRRASFKMVRIHCNGDRSVALAFDK